MAGSPRAASPSRRMRTRTNPERQDAFDRFSRIVDGPLMALALLMVPLLVVPFVVELSEDTERIFLALDYLIWQRLSSAGGCRMRDEHRH